MNIPKLPNHIIMDILKYRKDIKYLDRKYEEAQMNKLQLLDEINYMVDDLDMCLTNMFDNHDSYEEEEIEELENTPYSLLLLENICNFKFYVKCEDNQNIYDETEDY
jgi:hypothetical protein